MEDGRKGSVAGMLDAGRGMQEMTKGLAGGQAVAKVEEQAVLERPAENANTMCISVVVLTFNSERTIAQTLTSARQVSDDIHVVDSYSTDRTLEIAASFGARIVQHPFLHYGDQRNWAIDNLPVQYGWQLHLDADEFLSPCLVAEIKQVQRNGGEGFDGFYLPRMTRFLGREIRHGGHYPTWHLRLFRNEAGRCESRRYDQHFILHGRARRITAPMIDDNRMSLQEWTERHNRWSEAEADEILTPTREGVIQGKLGGTPMENKRALRALFVRTPLFARSFAFFFYRYFLRLGFLDGVPGLIYNVLQTFWYRFLIDAKLYERRMEQESVRLEEEASRR
jgi:glycosyltransferase involved in cell wall biosynthesis